MHVCVLKSYSKIYEEFQAELTHLVDVTWQVSPLEVCKPRELCRIEVFFMRK